MPISVKNTRLLGLNKIALARLTDSTTVCFVLVVSMLEKVHMFDLHVSEGLVVPIHLSYWCDHNDRKCDNLWTTRVQ